MMYPFIEILGNVHAIPGRCTKAKSLIQNQHISIAAEIHTNPKSFVFSEARGVIVH